MRELTLRDVLKIIQQRIWLVVLLPVFAVIITAIVVFYVIAPTYTATASMYVLNKQNADSSSVNYSDLQSSSLLTADYRELVLSKRVLGAVSQEYGLKSSDFDVDVTSANNTRIIQISATTKDPVLSANLANSIGQEFAVVVVEIMDANNVNFVDIAVPPTSPSGPRKTVAILIAAVAGLLLGIIIAVLIEAFNTTIRTVEDVEEHLGLTVLARVPKFEVK